MAALAGVGGGGGRCAQCYLPTGTGTGTGSGLPPRRANTGPAGRLVHMPRTGVEDEVEVALAVARLLVDQTCAERGLG